MEPESSQTGGWLNFLGWVMVNRTRLIIGAVVVLAVLVVSGVFVLQAAEREASASRALSEVRIPLSVTAEAPAGAAEALVKVGEKYQGTGAAERALLISAGLAFEKQTKEGYEEALKRFTSVVEEYPESTWIPQASLGVAASLAALGQTNEAIAKYEEIRKRLGDSSVIDEARLALARFYEAEKQEEAYKLYSELSKEVPGTAIGMEAGMRQAVLEKAHPELARLNEPAKPVGTPGGQEITITPEMLANAAKEATNAAQSPPASGAPAQPGTGSAPSPAPAPGTSPVPQP